MVAEAILGELRQLGLHVQFQDGALQTAGNEEPQVRHLIELAGVFKEEIAALLNMEASSDPPHAAIRISGKQRLPRITANGDLAIPLDAPAKYRWWSGGQSVVETLRELQVPREVWVRYTDEVYWGEE